MRWGWLFIGGMAGTAGLVDYVELFCEAGGVVGGRQGSQPRGRPGVIRRRMIEARAVLPYGGKGLRSRSGITLTGAGREHSRKSLCPLGERGGRKALTLGITSRFHGILHRVERDGGHVQGCLPDGDDIETGY